MSPLTVNKTENSNRVFKKKKKKSLETYTLRTLHFSGSCLHRTIYDLWFEQMRIPTEKETITEDSVLKEITIAAFN